MQLHWFNKYLDTHLNTVNCLNILSWQIMHSYSLYCIFFSFPIFLSLCFRSNQPLAQLYGHSSLEHHHNDMCLLILNNPVRSHNIYPSIHPSFHQFITLFILLSIHPLSSTLFIHTSIHS